MNDINNLEKKILIFLIYFVAVCYSLEFLSIVFLKKKIDLNEISIDQIRDEKIKSIDKFICTSL